MPGMSQVLLELVFVRDADQSDVQRHGPVNHFLTIIMDA